MRLKPGLRRPVRGWLWFLGTFCLYIAVAILIGVMVAHGAPRSIPPCQPPDPVRPPIVKLAAGELRTLAALAWAEARGEPDAYCSMQAVAAVVVNRMRTNPGYFGATITQVVHRPYQFSPFGRADPNRVKMSKVDESSPSYVAALLAAIAAVSGADPVAGATYFYSGRSPRWTAGMLVTARIGGHTFLRSP